MSMFAINHVALFGNLTREPELKSLPSGLSVCDIGLAVNESVKQQDGSYTDRAHFFNISIFGKMGEFIARECSKGTPMIIEGRLRFRQWDAPDGSKRSTVDIVANKAIPVGRRPKSDGSQSQGQAPPTAAGGPWDPQGGADIDGDIPFAWRDSWAGIDGPLL